MSLWKRAPKEEHWDYSNPIKDGYLTKRSKHIHQWRRRYFILKGNKLYFFVEAPTDAGPYSKTPPHGSIELIEYFSVKTDEQMNRPYCFELLTGGEKYYLCADSENSKQQWMSAVGAAFVQSSNSFTATDVDDYVTTNKHVYS
mmetsp:Transcript_9366/g.16134  ORF Transcript_9366/g.16134 Transcript_9366/m.16134 type:complete len:143 (+) Transcript_9366:71-499(+)